MFNLNKGVFAFGAGTGIIIVSVIMLFIYSIEYKDFEPSPFIEMSDEAVIERARILGMTFDNQEEIPQNTPIETTNVEDETGEDYELEIEDEELEDEEFAEAEEEVFVPQLVTQTSTSSYQYSNSIDFEEVGEDSMKVYVRQGDPATEISNKLKEAGIIEDSEDFIEFVGEHNSHHLLRQGEFTIPKDSSYEDILNMLKRDPSELQ